MLQQEHVVGVRASRMSGCVDIATATGVAGAAGGSDTLSTQVMATAQSSGQWPGGIGSGRGSPQLWAAPWCAWVAAGVPIFASAKLWPKAEASASSTKSETIRWRMITDHFTEGARIRLSGNA